MVQEIEIKPEIDDEEEGFFNPFPDVVEGDVCFANPHKSWNPYTEDRDID